MSHRKPSIKTKLPGPNAKRVIAQDHRYLSPSYTRDYPFVMDHGEGCWVSDVDGNVFLDFTAGIAVTSTGHAHPKVVNAIKNQAKKFLHMCAADFYYEVQAKLAEKLAEITPGSNDKRVYLCNSGTEAIEAALKLARYHTKRKQFIAFYGGFHGRTYGSLSLTASKVEQKVEFFPFLPGVHHAPFPNPLNCPKNISIDDWVDQHITWIEDNLFKRTVAPTDVAAIIVEPIQGEGGYIVPPDNFLPKLQRLCQHYDILLILDEIQAGIGRTGQWFGCEHFNIEPDMITVAKGIASGLPIGALITRHAIMDWPKGSHASTFGGNPLACAAAIETLSLIENEMLANTKKQGDYLQHKLQQLMQQFNFVIDVRGLGLMQAIEIGDTTAKSAVELRTEILQMSFHNGLILLPCGQHAIRFCPPLCISREEIDVGCDILQTVFTKLASQ